MTKQWVVAPQMPDSFAKQFPEINPAILQLLWNRGINTEIEVDSFLHPDYAKDLHDPFLFTQMRKAVDRIFAAIDNKEKIVVYGDYDADGVPGSVILKTCLDALGAETSVYLPNREKEGYGLSKPAMDFIKGSGARLVITCDCGISNREEIAWAGELAIDVIVTDHHLIPKELPKAFAIIHPFLEKEGGYPFPYLTGGAVAFKLVQALIKERGKNLEPGFEKWLLDLVAISLVADVGKLVGENRTLLKYGLIVLNKTRRQGLQKMYEGAGIKPGSVTPTTISWQIAPRINSAGRMDHANVAFELLISTDEAEAEALAKKLEKTNSNRQKATELVMREATELIKEEGDKPAYVLHSPNWNSGVVGLSAGKLVERYGRPVILATNNEAGKIVGSARSIEQLNVTETFSLTSQFMLRYGGHPKAAGFTVADLDQWKLFKQEFEKVVGEKLKSVELQSKLRVDAEVSISEVNWDLVNTLEELSPYGEGNPEPRFLLQELEISDLSTVGGDGQHLRLSVKNGNGGIKKLIGFCFADPDKAGVDWCATLSRGSKVDAVCEIGVNTWNGNKEIQMKIVDLRLSV